jgi:hypothetical protein
MRFNVPVANRCAACWASLRYVKKLKFSLAFKRETPEIETYYHFFAGLSPSPNKTVE